MNNQNSYVGEMNWSHYLEFILWSIFSYAVFGQDISALLNKIAGHNIIFVEGSLSKLLVHGSIYVSMFLCTFVFMYSFVKMYLISQGKTEKVPSSDSKVSIYLGACFSEKIQWACYFLLVVTFSIFIGYGYGIRTGVL
jgi:hypothetical protein